MIKRIIKVFISQPMQYKTDEEIKLERNKAIQLIKETKEDEVTKVELIDSFFESAPHDAKPLWFLGKSIELLSKADLAVFIGDWQNARGCKIEHTAAIEYGIEVLEL